MLHKTTSPPLWIDVDPVVDRHGFHFGYRTSAGDVGDLTVAYPFDMGHAEPICGAITLAVAVYLGQLCLAERIRINAPLPTGAIESLTPVARMLYDIRRWKDGRAPGEAPIIDAPTAAHAPRPILANGEFTTVLWSGGKDSTLSALLLRENGYTPVCLHLTVNSGVSEIESTAVRRLAAILDLQVHTVDVRHAEFLQFSSRYGIQWNQRPLCNTVPFGRDLLTAVLAAPAVSSLGATTLSLGHDNECRNAYVTFDGRRVPRNDVESIEGAIALQTFLSTFVDAGMRLLPPVAGLSELRILREMLVGHPDLMRQTAFCFWGDRCGHCAKCLRYHIAQRHFGVDVLSFAVDPLGDNGAPELDDLFRPGADGVIFQRQVLVGLARLVERGDIRASETRVQEFERRVLPLVADKIDVWEAELMATGTDPQLPTGWRYPPAVVGAIT